MCLPRAFQTVDCFLYFSGEVFDFLIGGDVFGFSCGEDGFLFFVFCSFGLDEFLDVGDVVDAHGCKGFDDGGGEDEVSFLLIRCEFFESSRGWNYCFEENLCDSIDGIFLGSFYIQFFFFHEFHDDAQGVGYVGVCPLVPCDRFFLKNVIYDRFIAGEFSVFIFCVDNGVIG